MTESGEEPQKLVSHMGTKADRVQTNGRLQVTVPGTSKRD